MHSIFILMLALYSAVNLNYVF